MSAKKSILFVAAVVVALGLAAQAQAQFTPTSISSLQSWLNPADGTKVTVTSGSVSNVVDSKNGLNYSPYNATTGLTYNTSAFTNGSGPVAGLQFPGLSSTSEVLDHSPSSDMLHLAAAPSTQWACFAVIDVNAPNQAGNDLTIFDSYVNAAEQIFQVSRNGALQFYPGSTNWIASANGTVSFNTPHIVEFEYSGGATPTMQMYLDGSPLTLTGTVVALTMNSSQGLYVGAQSGNDNRFKGLMGDLLNFNSVLSSTNRNNVGAFLQTEYGISGAYVGTVTPEPSTLVLLAAGLAGLLCYAWRKRR
jgi:hypothetical protein